MRAKSFFLLVLVGALSLAAAGCGGKGDPADPSGSRGHEVEAEEQFEVNLVRITDLEATGRAAFANPGADALVRGKVEVEEIGENEVKVEVRGAAANATYTVSFCSFATGISNCLAVNSLTTNADGNAHAKFQFPQRGGFAGVFVLARGGQNQFVTGFAVPTTLKEMENENEGEEDENFEVSLQPASVISAGLGSSFGTNGDDPLAAGRIEVERDRQVEVKVNGAVANATYAVKFCRFGVAPSGCVSVGSFSTDAQGNGAAELNFPLMGTFNGIFIVTRNVSGQDRNEFVTGFRIL